MSISVRKNSLAIYRWLGSIASPASVSMPKRIVAACLCEIDKLPRFGIGVYMNEGIIKERLKIAVVTLEKVVNTRKAEKMGLCRERFADWKTALDVLSVTS